MKWLKRPGFHQLTGPASCGKTTYAILQSVGRDRVGWVGAPLDDPMFLFSTLGWQPDIFVEAGRVSDAFWAMRDMQRVADFIVLDSLAALMPDHPQSPQIARDVERAWFRPSVPILIINQQRYPAAPGGSLWQGALTSARRMISICQYPLVTWIGAPFEVLIWAPGGGPIINPLSEMCLIWHVDRFAERQGVFAQKQLTEESDGHKKKARSASQLARCAGEWSG